MTRQRKQTTESYVEKLAKLVYTCIRFFLWGIVVWFIMLVILAIYVRHGH